MGGGDCGKEENRKKKKTYIYNALFDWLVATRLTTIATFTLHFQRNELERQFNYIYRDIAIGTINKSKKGIRFGYAVHQTNTREVIRS